MKKDNLNRLIRISVKGEMEVDNFLENSFLYQLITKPYQFSAESLWKVTRRQI